jgi:Xaa-Pro aminopeptidase
MRDERTLRVAEAARKVGADWALLTSPDAVCYATQHTGILETGPSPFAGGPSLAFVSSDASTVALLVNNLEEADATQAHADRVLAYVGIALDELSPVETRYETAVKSALHELGVGGTIAVEAATFPQRVGAAVAERGGTIVAIDRELDRARATKTPEEIDRLRRCAELTAIGQREALEAAQPGRSELEIWAEVRLAMEQAEGVRLPVAGDLTSGIDNTAAISGWPTDRVVQEGDPILCDLAPRSHGYWGDSCNTIFLGEPGAVFQKLYSTTKRAVEVVRETLRAGISADEFDRTVRAVFEKAGVSNPIHVGHGIGTGVHEWPRIVPGQKVTLEPNMVLMVEPGAYEPGVGGVRLEWMYLVTDTGNEVLSGFPHTMHRE